MGMDSLLLKHMWIARSAAARSIKSFHGNDRQKRPKSKRRSSVVAGWSIRKPLLSARTAAWQFYLRRFALCPSVLPLARPQAARFRGVIKASLCRIPNVDDPLPIVDALCDVGGRCGDAPQGGRAGRQAKTRNRPHPKRRGGQRRVLASHFMCRGRSEEDYQIYLKPTTPEVRDLAHRAASTRPGWAHRLFRPRSISRACWAAWESISLHNSGAA